MSWRISDIDAVGCSWSMSALGVDVDWLPSVTLIVSISAENKFAKSCILSFAGRNSDFRSFSSRIAPALCLCVFLCVRACVTKI